MTRSVGETFVIWHEADRDPEGTPITPADVDRVTATFFDRSWVVVGVETTMPWVEARVDVNGAPIPARWELAWDTTGLVPGRYHVRIRIYGLAGSLVWEDLGIRLARDPVATG